jgi:putative transposase
MARLARVTALHTPHHITQRGNGRCCVFETDADRLVYLRLLQHNTEVHGVSLAGYCLMANHVHLIAIPKHPDSLALAMKNTHGRYAAYYNARHSSSGHLWQGRYYSCPLDPPHLWAALRYTELNPVRAGLVPAPQDYPWSSAAVHCGTDRDDPMVDPTLWRAIWTQSSWNDYLASAVEEDETDRIRRTTHTGRPLGSHDFVATLTQRR